MRRIGAVLVTAVATISLAVTPARAAPSDGNIAGRVTSAATGAGLPHFGYRIFDSHGSDRADGATDDNGDYRAPDLRRGTYVVCFVDYGPPPAEGVGYPRRCSGNVPWDGFDVPAGAQGFTVSAGMTTTVDLALPAAAGIRGRVLDAASATPVSDAYVYAFGPDGRPANDYNSHTGSDGVYNLGRLDPDGGPFVLCFSAGPFDSAGGYYPTAPYAYVPQCYDRTPWGGYSVEAGGYTVPAGGKSVPVTGGQTVTGIGARLTPAGAISGAIRDASGTPVDFAELIAYAPDGHVVRKVDTNEDGTYSIALPAGSYRVCVSGSGSSTTPAAPKPGYASQCWRSQPWTDIGTPLPDAATPVVVSAGAATTGINMRLQPGGQIRVTVLDADGHPIGDYAARVGLYDATGTRIARGSGNRASRVYFPSLTASTSGYPVCAEGFLRAVRPTCWPNVAWGGGDEPVPSAARRIKMGVGQQRSITITLPDSAN